MKIDMQGRKAVVTGSTLGIGRAIAEGLARAGAAVVINGRGQERVATALRELRQLFPKVELTGVNAQALVGSRLVKAFNHLPARTLAADPDVKGGRRVIFLSSDDDDAASQVAALVEQLGFAPVMLGKLAEGGLLVTARGDTWTQLIFQDLIKFN